MVGLTKNNKKIILFLLLIFGFFIINSTALALQVEWPNSPVGTPLNDKSSLPDLIKYLYEWGISLGGLAVFISLIISGIQYLTSFGDPLSMKNAMERIKSAFFGLILLLSSWLILNTINPDLTTFQALTTEPPGETLGACDTDDECIAKYGKNYKCFHGFCAQDFASIFEIIPCERVLIKGYTIEAGDSAEIYIAGGSSITFTSLPALPDGCMGYLELYPRTGFWGGCGGDKQQIILRGGTATDEVGDPIRCIRLKEIETF
ncbi:MAG: hypothetical protein ABIA08_01120 [bacterium]